MPNLYASMAALLSRTRISPVWLQLPAAVLFTVSMLQLIDGGSSLIPAALTFLAAALLELTSRHVAVLPSTTARNDYALSVLLRFGGYGMFLTGLGVYIFLFDREIIFLFAILLLVLVCAYIALLLIRYPIDSFDARFGLHPTPAGHGLNNDDRSRRERVLFAVSRLADPAIFPWLIVILSVAGMAVVLFWFGLVILLITVLFRIYLLHLLRHDAAAEITRGTISYLFYIGGASVLLLLILRLPISDLVEAVQVIGPEDIWLILVPALWVIPYAITLQVLLDYRISFRDALYTQISGDAFNSITPLLGLGGEPYKAAHLSRFVPLEDAGRAIIQSRLIHAISGVLFTVIILTVTILVTDLSDYPGVATAMKAIAFLMFLVFALLLRVTLSRVPTQLTAFILAKLKIPQNFNHDRISWKKMWWACLCKMAGRAAKFLELYLIFVVLDMSPDLADVVLVESMIMISVSLFFFVPQGLGVNEAGIVTAFSIAGYAGASGIVFGLIRRARMILYTLAGLLVYLLAALIKLHRKRHQAAA